MVGSNAVRTLMVFLIFGFFMSSAAQAKKRSRWTGDSVQIHSVHDPELGGFKIEVINKRHPDPILLPYRVSVLLMCKDRREKPQSEGPKPEIILDSEPSCKYVTHDYNREKSALTVEYWISSTMEGEGQCDTKVEQFYYLADLCADFRP